MVGLALAVYKILHAIVAAPWPGQFHSWWADALHKGKLDERLLAVIGGTWTLLLPLGLLQLWHRPRLWRNAGLVVLLLGAVGQTLVGSDTERLVAFGYPAVLGAAAVETDWLLARSKGVAYGVWAVVLGVELAWWVAAAANFDDRFRYLVDVSPVLRDAAIVMAAVTLAVVVVAVAGWVQRRAAPAPARQ
jgi:hypothetical protein